MKYEMVPFADHQLAIFTDEAGVRWVNVQLICQRLRISYGAQTARIKRAGGEGTRWKVVRDGTAEFFCLEARRVYGWVDRIDPAECPDERTRLMLRTYQNQVDEVLADYAEKGMAVAPTADPLAVMKAQHELIGTVIDSLHAVDQKANKALLTSQAALGASEQTHGMGTIRGFLRLWKRPLDEWEASALGQAATAECRVRGIRVGKIPDTRHGTVNTYPVEFLEEFFTRNVGPKPA